jgi:hypothetical protein
MNYYSYTLDIPFTHQEEITKIVINIVEIQLFTSAKLCVMYKNDKDELIKSKFITLEKEQYDRWTDDTSLIEIIKSLI